MRINSHIGDVDPSLRKRQIDASKRAERPDRPDPSSRGAQAAARLELSSQDIDRYVAILKEMDPVDLHRVEDIRQRIADGSYQADIDDLVDPLLQFLGDDEPA